MSHVKLALLAYCTRNKVAAVRDKSLAQIFAYKRMRPSTTAGSSRGIRVNAAGVQMQGGLGPQLVRTGGQVLSLYKVHGSTNFYLLVYMLLAAVVQRAAPLHAKALVSVILESSIASCKDVNLGGPREQHRFMQKITGASANRALVSWLYRCSWSALLIANAIKAVYHNTPVHAPDMAHMLLEA
eukprot:1143240-Pelagomonas_calceolata.AAC.5